MCVLDQAGAIVCEATIAASPSAFLKVIEPFRDGLVVGCECMFAWYWLADLCAQEQIAFVLGHALYHPARYMKTAFFSQNLLANSARRSYLRALAQRPLSDDVCWLTKPSRGAFSMPVQAVH